MEIKFPDNPNIYFILIGFVLIGWGFSLVSTEGIQFINILIFLEGGVLVAIGLGGLRGREQLENKKLETEIELLNAKVSSEMLGR